MNLPPAPRRPGQSPNPYAPPLTQVQPSQVAHQNQPLVDAVLQGSRFIVVPYNFSIVILAFKRSMGGVKFVAPGQWPMGEVFGATAITGLFGWWGFPFGLIWTVANLFHLWNGGRDVTQQVLAAEIGPVEAKRVIRASHKAKLPAGIWGVRALIAMPVCLFLGFVLLVASS